MKKFIALALATILFMVAFCIHSHCRYVEWLEDREVIEVRVQSGDTLNGISYEYKPSWMNVSEYSYLILDLNDMDNSNLYAGDTIKIYAVGGNS